MYTDLPSEITLLIASQLDSPADLLSYSLIDSTHYHLLIRHLYRMNVRSDGGSALVWFARRGSETGVRHMLAAGANVNLRGPTRPQPTALLEAVIYKHTRVVQILLESGATPDAAYPYSRRPLILATRGHCDLTVTQILLEYGANVNQAKGDKHAPLFEAVRSNQERKVALLLQHRADVHIVEPRHAMNLLHIAASVNATPGIIRMLLYAGIPIDSQDGLGRTPLQVSAAHSCLRALNELLKRGANANISSMNERTKGWTALFYASGIRCWKTSLKAVISTLVRHGAYIDATNHVQQTPLLHAISKGAITQAQELLNQGASIMARTGNGETVLHFAASTPYWTPDICMVRWLVDRGADVNWAGGPQGETPLFYAIRGTDGIGRARLLLSLGADANFRNIHGETPLSLAARVRSLELTALLLEHGAAVDSQDLEGKYALHHVAESTIGGTQTAHRIIALLIENGADVHCRDALGLTPLHWAAAKEWGWRPYWQEVGELLKAGADPHAKSNDGRCPHHMVPDSSQAEAQRLILQHYDPFRFNS